VANTLSAKKRNRQNVAARARNRRRRERVKQAIRSFDEAIKQHDTEGASRHLKDVYKQLDQVAAKGMIHKKAADRRKARLAGMLSRAGK
jgi:small subunit ribosomal protein S20